MKLIITLISALCCGCIALDYNPIEKTWGNVKEVLEGSVDYGVKVMIRNRNRNSNDSQIETFMYPQPGVRTINTFFGKSRKIKEFK